MPIAESTVHFNPNNLIILNVILSLVMFGMALELKKDDFTSLIKNKKSAAVGLLVHFFLLPLLTFGLVKVLHPPPAVALGMILVGACPGGNMSNMFTYMAKGNTALAVGLTSVSHLLAIVFTPLNFSIYGSYDAGTAALLCEIHLSVSEILSTVIVVVGIPLLVGMLMQYYRPALSSKIVPYAKRFALLAFAFFLVVAVLANKQVFIENLPAVLPLVVVHNAVALFAGYVIAKLAGLHEKDVRTITFETGVQNSGLGLILIFTFFNGMLGMAIIAAMWGVWHLISGGLLAWFWSKKPLPVQ
jgi:BASS family bile acid:Na+ symporter